MKSFQKMMEGAKDVAETNYFEQLNNINVNGKTETKANLTYLSWPFAVSEIKRKYPDMQYEIEKFDGLPYVYDEKTGYMVYTKVTINGITHEMWLPVMDGNNKAMKSTPYTYQTRAGEKTVEAATMFDINKTIMRCLVKNFAMHGLGLYIYAGEDLPEDEKAEAKEIQSKAMMAELKDLWDKAGGKDGFDDWFTKNTKRGFGNDEFMAMKTMLLKKINDAAEKEKK